MAGWELADEELRTTLRDRGYIKDTPAPAVYHLNGRGRLIGRGRGFTTSFFPTNLFGEYLTYDELKEDLLSLDVASGDNCPVCKRRGRPI